MYRFSLFIRALNKYIMACRPCRLAVPRGEICRGGSSRRRVYMYICMYVCVCVYIYIYIYNDNYNTNNINNDKQHIKQTGARAGRAGGVFEPDGVVLLLLSLVVV